MAAIKSMNEYKKSALSLVDDIGALYLSENKVLRGINETSVAGIRELLDSGLVDELVTRGLFPNTMLSDSKIEGYSIVIEHEKIIPAIYPFEWSPEMLRRAALCVLEVNECANKYGYELKDAHPFNVMFKHTKPIFVDLGSLIKRQALSVGWRSYNEFLSSFYYPLRLCEKRLINLYKLLYLIRGDAAGIAEMATLVNPLFSIVGVRFTGKIFKLISIYRAGPSFEREKIDAKFSNPILKMIAKFILKSMWFPCRRPNIILLAERIKSINLRQKTEWGNYHAQAGFYGEDGNITLSPRMDWVRGVVAELRPRSIIELAGNQGILSRILAQVPGVEKVICSDYDENSIDALLLNSRDDEKVSMACFDFMAGTWQALSNERADRLRSEMVIALAVTHHLILSQNFSIDSILSAIINYSSKYLIIEFMPLGLWGGNSAPPLPAWYSEAWFVNNLNRYCEIIQRIDLEPNRIAFVAKIKGSS